MEMITLMEKKNIETKVDEIISKFSYEKDVDIVEIAKSYGFVVGEATLPEAEDGFIRVDDKATEIFGIKTSRLIAVNASREFIDKRFIIAHELGHFFLHYDSAVNSIFAHRENIKGKNEQEQDVDYFAACLLMPEKSFRKFFSDFKKVTNGIYEAIIRLSEIFKVPLTSAKRRCEELGLKD